MARRKRRQLFLAIVAAITVAATSLCPVECFAKPTSTANTDCHDSKSPIGDSGRKDAGCCGASLAPRAPTVGMEPVGAYAPSLVPHTDDEAASLRVVGIAVTIPFGLHDPPPHLIRSPILLI